MFNFDALPQFLKDRITAMPIEVQKPFLHTIDKDWVDVQIAAHGLMQGVKDGRWTMEDIKNEWTKKT